MKLFIFTLTLGLIILLSDLYIPQKLQATLSPTNLVVHEWGTFTSVAGKRGTAIDWRPLNGASDLPSFVYKEGEEGFRGTYQTKFSGKDAKLVKIRMETPVIYFYTEKEMEVDVNVKFPQGRITEWYPQAGIVDNYAGKNQRSKFQSNGINWGTIKLLPNEQPNYLREATDSHYYPARETDAVAVQVCNADKTKIEKEKFLFYRGVGDFELPLRATTVQNKLTLSDGSENYGTKGNIGRNLLNLVVFENRNGKVGYKTVPNLSVAVTIERPELDKTLPQVFDELENRLVEEGLYKKEAKAMLETWKDSWFEEGLRVFYILPRMTVDEILPLQIEPRPKETTRVFVGRTEVITPEMEQDVRKQVFFLRSGSAEIRQKAQENLKKYGRFYEPVLKIIFENEKNRKVRKQIEDIIKVS